MLEMYILYYYSKYNIKITGALAPSILSLMSIILLRLICVGSGHFTLFALATSIKIVSSEMRALFCNKALEKKLAC